MNELTTKQKYLANDAEASAQLVAWADGDYSTDRELSLARVMLNRACEANQPTAAKDWAHLVMLLSKNARQMAITQSEWVSKETARKLFRRYAAILKECLLDEVSEEVYIRIIDKYVAACEAATAETKNEESNA